MKIQCSSSRKKRADPSNQAEASIHAEADNWGEIEKCVLNLQNMMSSINNGEVALVFRQN